MKLKILSLLTTSYLLLATPAFAQQATLSLSPSSGTFNKGCGFSLQVLLNTGGAQTDGTDVILFYDPSRFSATSITSGTIYPDYPGNNIDATNGKITISGLASVTTPFTGSGTLATINFSVLDNAPAGTSQIKFDFDPNNKSKTTDSNVVERGNVVDILNSVVDGNYTIGTGICASPSPGASGAPKGGPGGGPASGSAQPIPKPTLPPTGTEGLTYVLTTFGLGFVVLGILGLALL